MPTPFGPYLLEARLGQGGMAEVFHARVAKAHGFEKELCIKRVLPRFRARPELLALFIREAKIAARLSHPNVAQVFDLGEVDGAFYIAMELVRGPDLATVRAACEARGWAMPPAAAAYVAREVLRALEYAHELTAPDGTPSPVVHRDVSPHNVVLGASGVVKLVDFGLAKMLEEEGLRTRTGVIRGKVAYLAPEQAAGGRASTLSDIFAAGVVLFEMLANRRLFRGTSDYDTLMRVRSMPIPAPSSINRAVPAALDQIALRALARPTGERYPRAAQMARDLDRFCAQAEFGAAEMKRFLAGLSPSVLRATQAPPEEPAETLPDAPASTLLDEP